MWRSMMTSPQLSGGSGERLIQISSSASEVTGFDFAGSVRWARFDPGKTLARRPAEALPFLQDNVFVGQELLLDTCVYIDGL
jgi:hypothetical protein